MTERGRLPKRRASESFTFEVSGLRYTATFSRFADGRVGELFLNNHKSNNAADTNARDAAITFSIAVQHGGDPEVIRRALCRDNQGRIRPTRRRARPDRRRRRVMIATAQRTTGPSLAFLQDVFRERCEARAILFAAGELDLHEAVDVLQRDAERDGLVAAFGQDEVQAFLAAAFCTVRGAGMKEPSDEGTRRDLPTSTVQAVEYLIQQNDPKRMRSWFAKHTPNERLAIRQHFERRT